MLSVVGPAIVVAVAPVTLIIALTLVVSARTPGAVVGFAIARTASIGAVATVCAVLSSVIAADPALLRTIASMLEFALAAILVGVAIWAWVKRADRVEEPRWMLRVEQFGWGAGALLGLVIWLVNPKVLVTVIITGLVLGAQPPASGAGMIAAFVLLGSAPVLAVAAARVLVGRSAHAIFARVREWLVRHGWLVLAAVSLLVAVLLTIDASGGLRA